jgi:hypothetical protein
MGEVMFAWDLPLMTRVTVIPTPTQNLKEKMRTNLRIPLDPPFRAALR